MKSANFGQVCCPIDEHLANQNGRFNFHESLKWYLRNITKGEIVDDDTVPDTIEVEPDNFVKFVVRHLGEVF